MSSPAERYPSVTMAPVSSAPLCTRGGAGRRRGHGLHGLHGRRVRRQPWNGLRDEGSSERHPRGSGVRRASRASLPVRLSILTR